MTRETRTTEEIPLEGDSKGLGMPGLQWLEQASDEELDVANVRLYRALPTGQEWLQTWKPAERITEETIEQMFGGGTYRLKVYVKPGMSSFESIKLRGEPKVFTPKVEVIPPAPAATTGEQSLAAALERQTALIERLFERANSSTSTNGPQTPTQALDIVAHASEKAVDMIASRAGNPAAAAPAESLKDTVELLKGLLAVVQPQQPAAAGLLGDLSTLKLLKEVFGAPAATSTNAVDQFKSLAELATILDTLRGEGGAKDWKASLIETVGDKLPTLVDGIKGIVSERTRETQIRATTALSLDERRRQAASGAPAVPAVPAARAPAPVAVASGAPVIHFPQVEVVSDAPGAPERHGNPSDADLDAVAAEQQAREATAAPPQMTQEQADAFERAIKTDPDAQLKFLLVGMIEQQVSGVLIVDFIDNRRPLVGTLLSHYDAAAIRKFFVDDPILSQALQVPTFEATLAEVIEVLHAPEEEEEAEEVEEEARPARKKRRVQ